MMNHEQSWSIIWRAFVKAPALQNLYLGLAAFTWLVGGNILTALHFKRLKKPWWSEFRPFSFPFKDFNTREWLTLLGLWVLTAYFGVMAISMTKGH
jgi:hypothetical protein